MRRDCESKESCADGFDLSSFCGGGEDVTPEFAKFCALVMLSIVEGSDAVVTDRLHVGIASALMGKETYLLDNSYEKVSSVYVQTLCEIPSVRMTDTVPKHLTPKRTASNNPEKLFRSVLAMREDVER